MQDRHDIEEVQRRRRHNEAMRAAGEQFSELIDGAGDAQKEAVVDALLEGLRQKYGVEEGGDDAA